MRDFIIYTGNFLTSLIPFVLFVLATVKGCKKGRRVAFKYFCGAVFILSLVGLWNICILMDLIGKQGMGVPELLAQHVGYLLQTVLIGSFLAHVSYTTILLSNFKKEHILADIFIMLTFITTFLCSYAATKFFQIMGGSQ